MTQRHERAFIETMEALSLVVEECGRERSKHQQNMDKEEEEDQEADVEEIEEMPKEVGKVGEDRRTCGFPKAENTGKWRYLVEETRR